MRKISVVMPVKNGENYISESIESVLLQSFTNFEFLIFDDNSSDRTLEIISSYKDDRIKVFPKTEGYIGNANKGIEISTGTYIARMDHDDIMMPEKLKMQFEIMEKYNIDVCGTAVYIFGEKVEEPYLELLQSEFVYNPLQVLKAVNFIHHATTLVKRDFLINNNIRYENYFPAEDYKYWFEIAKNNGKFYMIPQPLLYYRWSNSQLGAVYDGETLIQTVIIQKEIAEYLKQNNQ